HKKTGLLGFEMNLYVMQEFLGVLVVLAAATGTMLVIGIAFILFQEGIRRAAHGAKARIIRFKGSSAKDEWLQRAHSRSVLR
ncbi:MAG: hypothetical protein WBX16_21160, partial [Candidatus Acidiferrales bacterium]